MTKSHQDGEHRVRAATRSIGFGHRDSGRPPAVRLGSTIQRQKKRLEEETQNEPLMIKVSCTLASPLGGRFREGGTINNKSFKKKKKMKERKKKTWRWTGGKPDGRAASGPQGAAAANGNSRQKAT